MVVSSGRPGILPRGTIARHLPFSPTGTTMATSGCARSNRIRRATAPGCPPATARCGRSLMAVSWCGRGGALSPPAPPRPPCSSRDAVHRNPAFRYVPLSHACSPGRPGYRDSGGDLGAVRVHREQHAAEHDSVVRVELAAEVRDELLVRSLRMLLAPGRHGSACPVQVTGFVFAEPHRVASRA